MVRTGSIILSPSTTYDYIGEIAGRLVVGKTTKIKNKEEYIEIFVADDPVIKSLLKCTLPSSLRLILEKHSERT